MITFWIITLIKRLSSRKFSLRFWFRNLLLLWIDGELFGTDLLNQNLLLNTLFWGLAVNRCNAFVFIVRWRGKLHKKIILVVWRWRAFAFTIFQGLLFVGTFIVGLLESNDGYSTLLVELKPSLVRDVAYNIKNPNSDFLNLVSAINLSLPSVSLPL